MQGWVPETDDGRARLLNEVVPRPKRVWKARNRVPGGCRRPPTQPRQDPRGPLYRLSCPVCDVVGLDRQPRTGTSGLAEDNQVPPARPSGRPCLPLSGLRCQPSLTGRRDNSFETKEFRKRVCSSASQARAAAAPCWRQARTDPPRRFARGCAGCPPCYCCRGAAACLSASSRMTDS